MRASAAATGWRWRRSGSARRCWWSGEGAAAEHRVGTVPLREPSVVVAVAAAHRGPAFAAAREAIDRIKAEAPIWKREVEGERAEWVEGAPPPAG